MAPNTGTTPVLRASMDNGVDNTADFANDTQTSYCTVHLKQRHRKIGAISDGTNTVQVSQSWRNVKDTRINAIE
jgi:hypothetical protein